MTDKAKISEHISALRDKMRSCGIAAVVIPQTDPHQSEYIASHWQVRRWLSGFTGSAGALVVTLTHAYVWADSRYWLQAAQQLEGTGIGVMEEGKPGVESIPDFLCQSLSAGDVVGIDGMLFSIDATRSLSAKLAEHGIELDRNFDPADGVWLDRPSLPKDEIFVHEVAYAGESAADKLKRILAEVGALGASSIFMSDLAEIAWALNIRSTDVDFNPVVTSYLYVSPVGTTLFVDGEKITDEVKAHLAEAGVSCRPYESAIESLSQLPADAKVFVGTAQSSGALERVLGARMVAGVSPVALLKAVKNPVQIEGLRNALKRDGAALVKAFMEIEHKVAAGDEITELDVADVLVRFRSEQPLYFEPSFGTIAGFGSHGAVVHYSATPATNAKLHTGNLLLVDSGASYFDGTTDITRTIALGEPTDAQRRDFTLVMKGHIALATAVFPVGTRGAQLDALARVALWREGLSYLHGTGHGVGHFLNVHEGPQSIRLNENPVPLMPGMVTSNEPGLYRAGEYGIRCENLVLTVPAFATEFGEFLKFETITLFPFDVRLFDTSIMSDQEIAWVNAYHDEVYEKLSPMLSEAERAWLREKTVALTR